jgi:hypothetical protein
MESMFCIVCQSEIGLDRTIKKAVTCSDECKKKLKAIRRSHRDEKVCRQCARPSTPEERTMFLRWRRETDPAWQPKKPGPKKKTPQETPNEHAALEG